MAFKIAKRLNLPEPSVIIHIEDVASKEEIDTAMRIRYTEGKHVIPVPPLQITRNYPSIVYDSILVGLKKRFPFLPFATRTQAVEKTLVCPEFSKQEESAISETALSQMINHCLGEYGNTLKLEKISFKKGNDGYDITITTRTPQKLSNQTILDLEESISDSLEKYGGILIHKVSIQSQTWQ